MAAIITDQIRILNARNFLDGITTSGSSYYSFIGLPNATDIQSDWDNSPPAPVDNFDSENEIWETVISRVKLYNIRWCNSIKIFPDISITTCACSSWF